MESARTINQSVDVSILVDPSLVSEQREEPFGKATAASNTSLQHPANPIIARSQYEEPVRGPEEWQDHLKRLQQWVCELLIKNQQLRMALESITAQERKEEQDG